MGFIADWRAARERRRRADRFLHTLLTPPESADVDWLSALTVRRELAVRELTFARRALGLLVAERDALDDRTAADVAHALAPLIEAEARKSPDAGSAWAARRRAYSAAMTVRGQSDAPATRFARVLLEGAGLSEPAEEAVVRAAAFVQVTRSQANEALRAAFGVASLPEDVRPSAIRP
ncbi:MAG: hypothetical protein IPP90_18625 [Gemmatimonadaceae bacterium]|nr:hypothetical protein [Gemmatimonadaceae bacterium]